MARPAKPERRVELLSAILDHLIESPLAAAAEALGQPAYAPYSGRTLIRVRRGG